MGLFLPRLRSCDLSLHLFELKKGKGKGIFYNLTEEGGSIRNWYTYEDVDDVHEIINEHILHGHIVGKGAFVKKKRHYWRYSDDYQ